MNSKQRQSIPRKRLSAATWPFDTPQSAGQVLQQAPFVVVGAVSPTVHMVGKHHTFLQVGIALALPPCDPVAPTASLSSTMSGFTQYGQQWPGTDSSENPAGHDKLPQVMLAQGSTISDLTCTSIRVLRSLSRAISHLPSFIFSCNALMSLLAFTCFSFSVSFCSWARKPSWIWMFCWDSFSTCAATSGAVLIAEASARSRNAQAAFIAASRMTGSSRDWF